MESTMDPSTSSSVKEEIETMSNYAESYISEEEIDPEELQNRDLFEKPRGERRWLGREHHRVKERLHNSVKDRTFIEKTVKSTEPLSKNATKKINASTRDGLDFNVVYSLDKKNRWKTANTVSLLGATPENLNAEVVERDTFGIPEKSTFAVHSKQISPNQEPGEFEIRSATSSGKGQNYSNFLPETREFSKKANARMMTIRGEEQNSEKESVSQPTISYNIYKTHPSKEVVGSQVIKSQILSKSGRHRPSKRVDMEVYDDEDEFDYDEEDFEYQEPNTYSKNILDFSNLIVGDRHKQERRNRRKNSENSYFMVDAVEEEIEFSHLLNIRDYLDQEGYMFEQTDITFHNQKDNIEHQIKELQKEEKLIIKELRPRQYLIDVSKWCQLNKDIQDGETTTILVISHLKKNKYNVLVNSTIPCHPSKRGSEYLRKQLSSAMTMSETIKRITSEILTHRKIVETMKISTEFHANKSYQKLIHDSQEWENQLINMPWPNEYYHAMWANSEELSQVGGKLEWNDLCAMVRKDEQKNDEFPSDGTCGLCSQEKKSHELFSVENNSSIKCTDCLRDEFYRELRAKRIPIDLQTDTADELEYLPTFIPLTVINLYIRMVSEIIYKDLGANGDFGKCPSCKSAVFFETITNSDEKKTQNRSCPCGHSWCKHCNRVPHWPMKCGDFVEWEEKWLLRYAMTHAQGSGTETLLQVACSCGRKMYSVLLPKDVMECPACKLNVNTNKMRTFWKHYYFPFVARFRKLVEDGRCPITGGWSTIPGGNYHEKFYNPRFAIYSDISKIPPIRASVIDICGSARDIRYDVHFRNRVVNREHALIRKNIMEKEVVENLFGTSVYLVENVTAWMYMTNQNDKSLNKLLEDMMNNRRFLLESLEAEDPENIKKCIKKLRENIDAVVSSIENKIETSKR